MTNGIARRKKRESVGLGFFTTSNPNLPTQEHLPILSKMLLHRAKVDLRIRLQVGRVVASHQPTKLAAKLILRVRGGR